MKKIAVLAGFLLAGSVAGTFAWRVASGRKHPDEAIRDDNGGTEASKDQSSKTSGPSDHRKMKEIREGDVTVLLPEKVTPGEAATVTIRYLVEKIPFGSKKVSLAGFAVVRTSENREVGYIEIVDEKPSETGAFVIELSAETSRKAGVGGTIGFRLGLASETANTSDAFGSLSFDVMIVGKE